MTRKELEAAKAAALAKVAAEYDAKIAALDEVDWELFGTLLAAAKGRYAPDMVKLADFVVRHAHAFAAAPLMPTAATAMTDAEIEELAQDMVEKHVTGSDNFCEQSREFAVLTIRATIARLRPVRKAWPSEAELREMAMSVSDKKSTRYLSALEMARRLRERVQ